MENTLLPAPTNTEFIAARRSAGHSQTEAGALLGVTLRGVQGWEAPPGAPGARQCPAGLYTLYMLITHQHPRQALVEDE